MPEKSRRTGPSVGWLLLDAAFFTAVLYKLQDGSFLWADGAISAWRWIGVTVLALAAQVALDTFSWKPILTQSADRFRRAWFVVVDLLLLGMGGVLLPAYLIRGGQPTKGISVTFFPLEWHKFYLNLVLMARSSPLLFPAMLALFAGILWLRIRLRARFTVAALALLALAAYVTGVATFVTGESMTILNFAAPLVALAVVSLIGWPRIFARCLIGGGLFTAIGIYYFGVLPPGAYLRDIARRRQSPTPALTSMLRGGERMELLYPQDGEPSAIDLSFLREMVPEPSTHHLYVSYGPTSGVARIDTAGKRMDGLVELHGMIRFLWGKPGEPLFWGLDWLRADLYAFQKEPFRIAQKVDLFRRGDSPSPFDVAVSTARRRLYIVDYEMGGLEERDLDTFRQLRVIRFRDEGLTVFGTSGLRCKLDEGRGKIYVLFGEVDLAQRYRVMEVDLDSFRPERAVVLPSAGLEMNYSPEKGSLITGDFYSTDLFEVNVDRMVFERTIRGGPLCCRNVVFDLGRDRIYTTSFGTGEVVCQDYPTGKVLWRVEVGPKPASLAYVPEEDALYVGSAFGIFRVTPGER